MEEEFGGFYDDDGNKIDPNLIPKPGLCLSCKNDDDPSQEILCTLTRMDQMDEEEFCCFAYIIRTT
jgi:hypothetical protein